MFTYMLKNGRKMLLLAKDNQILTIDDVMDVLVEVIQYTSAEQQRDMIRANQREGIARARRNGVVIGRPSVQIGWDRLKFYEETLKLPRCKIAALPDIAKNAKGEKCSIGVKTLYRKLREAGRL
jgi:DNA invertase Pin-like site-specific DNA recombinase